MCETMDMDTKISKQLKRNMTKMKLLINEHFYKNPNILLTLTKIEAVVSKITSELDSNPETMSRSLDNSCRVDGHKSVRKSMGLRNLSFEQDHFKEGVCKHARGRVEYLSYYKSKAGKQNKTMDHKIRENDSTLNIEKQNNNNMENYHEEIQTPNNTKSKISNTTNKSRKQNKTMEQKKKKKDSTLTIENQINDSMQNDYEEVRTPDNPNAKISYTTGKYKRKVLYSPHRWLLSEDYNSLPTY